MNLPDLPALAEPGLAARVQHAIDHKTKPLGALGRIEALALQLALIQGEEIPVLREPQLVVFAADHGLSRRGVSAYPREVTPQMVANMLAGGAAVSVLARQQGLALTIADCGVDALLAPGAADLRIAPGTADASAGSAMTLAQAQQALSNGMALVERLPGNALLLGEMGIGNTSSASLLMQRLTGLPLADCVGRGTGLDDAGMARKLAVLEQALAVNAAALAPLDIAAALGGFEIVTMAGSVIAAAAHRRVVVVDGFITTAAVALAEALRPGVLAACVFGHRSAEGPHARWLQHLGVRPLLDLDLRLGEGSGAALAWPLLTAACALLADMASFDSAGVSNKD
ncbi:nicotinate-nucleotide--dimethylbenzimidazole phosphoribosyltransferase [Roseateles asaccharophilus]|uniref:Nicotinate-nucleotide--dimethylbenzimidazole phosphoribosyltransferase n=1 Tax=Roseateles asaccharophilus TaxID=582607 RepID=A0ABU2A5F1_9BURK|nr:nicotinate-nucleotide--dimethylbenzimidazole phosphoribosyltransferase [Roseateles asaccharophilus]MDR7332371.1 nicotinate-nucleotide--dimethylbenzimidazole phosphoribosyltransferase [Roseateles asaccharophilus]